MIANAYAHGRYTILEQGEIDQKGFDFKVVNYLVCDPAGKQLDPVFPTIDAARAWIDTLPGSVA